jgi:hypothetical protein
MEKNGILHSLAAEPSAKRVLRFKVSLERIKRFASQRRELLPLAALALLVIGFSSTPNFLTLYKGRPSLFLPEALTCPRRELSLCLEQWERC